MYHRRNDLRVCGGGWEGAVTSAQTVGFYSDNNFMFFSIVLEVSTILLLNLHAQYINVNMLPVAYVYQL